jgi:5'-3' exonuclease
VNALLGSVNIVLNEIAQHSPRAVVMCFGQDAADYRVKLYDGYHADRPAVPDELDSQFEAAPSLYDSLGWHVKSLRGLEADDTLQSLALAEERAGGSTLLLTGDRDMFQCVGEHCEVLYLRTGTRGAERVDERGVVDRYGIPPSLVPDFIALRGDPSDGLPGAPGIGAKTAADLLRRHGSLEAAITGAAGESPRVASTLREWDAQLREFKEIATLRARRVARPPDRPTNFKLGSQAARWLGMNRLGVRLESLARSSPEVS